MMSQGQQVMQFKVTLLEVKPPIWRRIRVPLLYSFWDLHVAIQDAMGWNDSHLHAFQISDPKTGEQRRFGIPSGEDWDSTVESWDHAIADYFRPGNERAAYEYDFGDNWQHTVELETTPLDETDDQCPSCVDGARRCPPEDCGGESGYEELLEVIGDPKHEEHERMLEWLGEPFDPEAFDVSAVSFDDPKERWQYAFGGRKG